MPQNSNIPLSQAGYFDTAAQTAYDTSANIIGRNRSLGQTLVDLGIQRTFDDKGNPVVTQMKPGDANYDPYNALTVARQQATTNTVDRGWDSIGSQQRMAYDPARAGILKQGLRAAEDTQFANTQDRIDRRRALAQAAQAAAQYGVKAQTWLPAPVKNYAQNHPQGGGQ